MSKMMPTTGEIVTDSIPSTPTRRSNCFVRIIEHHYRETPPLEKTEAQITSESYLFHHPPIPFTRWLIIPAAFLIQSCCGALYAWSVLNAPIDAWMSSSTTTSKAPLTFSIAIGTFGTSAAVLGPWIERTSPRTATLAGALLYIVGYLVSALALHLRLIWLLYLGYGVVGAVGTALCYLSAVSLLQKWYPERRGMASGLAVVGCGAGAMGAGQLLLPLSQGVGLPMTFVVLGCGFVVPLALSGMILRTPPPNFMPEVEQQDRGQGQDQEFSPMMALTSPNFRLLYLTFFANSLFGLVAMSRLSNMVQDIYSKTGDQGAVVVSINGLFDLGGRLVFSLLSDYLGRKNSFFLVLSTQLLLLGTLTVTMSMSMTSSMTSSLTQCSTCYYAFLASVWILTGCYGAGLGLLGAFLSDSFGPRNVGCTQGVIFTAWSLAGVGGGLVFTAVFDWVKGQEGGKRGPGYPYVVNFWWILALVGAGWVGLCWVEATPKDMVFRKRMKRIWGRIWTKFRFGRRDSYEMNGK